MSRFMNLKTKTLSILMLMLLALLCTALPAFAATYTYDSLNRLTSITYKPGQDITYTYDAAGNLLSVTATGFDIIPPVTSIILEGQLGIDNWYRSDVQVTLTAVDNPGGSGVNKIEYSFDGTTWLPYSVPFAVSAEGTTVVYYRSTDNEGNVEDKKQQEVKIDKTLPVITGAVTTQPNVAGWYNHDVTVHFTASDALSGINTVTMDTVISTEGINQSVSGTAKDKAGNEAVATVAGINIDKTAPVTSGAAVAPPNANGWYNTDVQVSLTAADEQGGSGMAKTEYSLDATNWTTYTQPFTVSTEGKNDVYYRSHDIAGNIETANKLTIQIDKTAPVLSSVGTPSPTAFGWNNTDVIVHFTATDATSGVASVTPDVTVTLEGANQEVVGTATDLAGNAASITHVVNIDKTLPVISGATTTQPNANSWYNHDVTVHFTASDELSGIDTITPDTTVSTEGANQSVTGTAKDKAGNTASATVSGINIDKTPPVTTITPDTAPNNYGWYNKDVRVTLAATDKEGGSGVAKTEYSFDGTNWNTYTSPVTISAEGKTDIYYRSTDKADNLETVNKLSILMDKTPPQITGAVTTPPNEYGWYNTDITVHFTASDALSGLDTVTPDKRITTEGANQTVTGTAVDKAGNSASFTVEKINLDKTKPEITISVPADGQEYLLNASVPANWLATDALSGIATANGNVPSGTAFDTASVGTKTFTVEAVDKAGNKETKTVTYYVRYNYTGLLEPIDGGKEFKGNTVPVKFRLTDANNVPVTSAIAKLYLTGPGGGEMDADSTSNATTGNLFRCGDGEGQYIFNLNTENLQAGTWRLRISLDDGTSKYGTIELAENGPPTEKPDGKKEPGVANDANSKKDVSSPDNNAPGNDNAKKDTSNPDNSVPNGGSSNGNSTIPDNNLINGASPTTGMSNPGHSVVDAVYSGQ